MTASNFLNRLNNLEASFKKQGRHLLFSKPQVENKAIRQLSCRKTKQLAKDFDSSQSYFNSLKTNYDNLLREDLFPAKNGVIDSESLHHVDATHRSTFTEPFASSYAFEADRFDISQDAKDYLN
ncbi:unnamed protein product [Amaranthus hypochondriacus]